MSGPLAGVRVLELAGLAPGPFGAMMLADHGAEVLRIDRVGAVQRAGDTPSSNIMDRGKRTIGLDIKNPDGLAAFKDMVKSADVVIEPFRPGVAERLGIGPDELLAINPRLIYGRMTGWGQDGPLAPTAGHDIDYIAISGVLSALGREGQPPTPPINIVGDFAGGGLMLAYGILLALIERAGTGKGQVVDAAMVDGAAVLFAMFTPAMASGAWGPRGTNLLDTGNPSYDVYETADGKWMAVGALEPQFWQEMVDKLGLADADLPDRNDKANHPELRKCLAETFRARTRSEWEAIFEGSDACVSPVLEMAEAVEHPHNVARQTYIEVESIAMAAPAPRLSGNPSPRPALARRLEDLSSWGLSADESVRLRESGVLA